MEYKWRENINDADENKNMKNGYHANASLKYLKANDDKGTQGEGILLLSLMGILYQLFMVKRILAFH